MAGRYQAYPEYKPSGVEWLGDIPEHWLTIEIGRLFRRVKRTDQANKELLSVYRDHGVVPKASRDDNNNKPSEDLSPYQLVEKNDLVLNKMKTWQGSIAVSDFEGIVSPAYFVYQPEDKLFKVADPKYVHFLVRNPMYIAQYLRRSKGIRVSQWDLDPGEFQRIELLLPPIPEQTQIAAFLNHETARIDALIAKQQRLIELLEEKRQAVISHAVTKGLNPNAPLRPSGIDWLGDVPAHWEVKRLKNLISDLESGVSVNASDVPAKPDEVAVLKTSCVYTRSFRIEENKTVLSSDLHRVKCPTRKGSIIISRMNTPDLVGASAIVTSENEKVFLPDRLWQTVFIDELLQAPEFLAYFMMIKGFRNQISLAAEGASSSMQSISKDDYLSINIALPALAEQVEVVQFLNAKASVFDGLRAKAQSAITLLKERRTALISAAVTGKIDVRDWHPPKPNSDQDAQTSEDAFA